MDNYPLLRVNYRLQDVNNSLTLPLGLVRW